MAETLTIDPTPVAEVAGEVEGVQLSPDEQDSLELGEKIQEQESNLLAGKYKNAEELESAYIALQKKLGDTPEDTVETPTDEVAEPKTEEKETEEKVDRDDYSFLDQLWEEAQGEYKPETLEQLSKMDPTALANMHLSYRNNNAPKDLTENDVKELKSLVGGDEGYSNMLKWANQNLNKAEVDMFDTVMDRGDPLAAFFAVNSLAMRYQDSIGYEGKMLTGSAPTDDRSTYRSQQEVVQAMSDPRYDNDPAYRQDVMKKLERSELQF